MPPRKKQPEKIQEPESAGASKKSILASLRKRIIKGNIDNSNVDIMQWFTTGIPACDIAFTGEPGKGIPSGRVIEIYGAESVGKTTLAVTIMANIQRGYDGIASLYETEATLSVDRLKTLGVNTSELLYGIEENKAVIYIEEVLQGIVNLVNSLTGYKKPPAGIIVFDTIAGTESMAERTKNIGEASAFSPHARALSRAFRKLSVPLSRTRFSLVCVNQMKAGAIGSMFALEREQEATLGGSAIKFHAYLRIRMKLKRQCYVPVKGKLTHIGDEILVSLTKHKESISGTRASECILVLRKYPPKPGTFSSGLSAFRTLQHWGMKAAKGEDDSLPIDKGGSGKNDKNSGLFIKGKVYKPLEFEAAYDSDPAFRKTVNSYLIAYRKARMGMEDSKAAAVLEEEEE